MTAQPCQEPKVLSSLTMAGRWALLGLVSVTLSAAQPADLRLVSAAREGKSGQAIRLVRDRADVNQRDERGYTPLIWAAAWGNRELAAALLERRARVNAVALNGATAFGIAAANGRDLIVRALIKAGANCVSLEPGWNPQTGARGPLASRRCEQSRSAGGRPDDRNRGE